MIIEVRPFEDDDRARWDTLARAYKAFYRTVLPDSTYDRTWQRLRLRDGIHGLGAHVDGRLIGISHYLFHTGIWSAQSCYLEDLYVEPERRGQGVARALIEAVAASAREHGATRLYWLTHESNATARALYDRVAAASGFIEYEYPMPKSSAPR
jgi:GNAT superfamily N-acetyltransferase